MDFVGAFIGILGSAELGSSQTNRPPGQTVPPHIQTQKKPYSLCRGREKCDSRGTELHQVSQPWLKSISAALPHTVPSPRSPQPAALWDILLVDLALLLVRRLSEPRPRYALLLLSLP